MRKINLLLGIIFMVSQLHSQSLMISQKNGNSISVDTQSISKITFTSDRTYALVVSQNDESQLEAVLTNIDKITLNNLTEVKSQDDALVNIQKFLLYQNYPNPFNPSTTIAYNVPQAGWITVQIFNVNGQLVRNLDSKNVQSGFYRVVWNGDDDNHQPVSAGVYIYKVAFNTSVQMKKLLLLK